MLVTSNENHTYFVLFEQIFRVKSQEDENMVLTFAYTCLCKFSFQLKSNMKKAKSFFKRKFSKSKKDEVEEISIKPEAEEVQHCWEIDVEVEDKVSKDKKKKGKKSKKHSLETVQNESGSRKSSAASNSRDVIPVVADAHFDGTATTDGTDDFDDECIEEVTLS